jgi:hypothetical protein
MRAPKRVWWCVAERLPEMFHSVLTYRDGDLHPVCAWWVKDGDKKIWIRAIEGPEDVAFAGKDCPLYAEPTHWREIETLDLPCDPLFSPYVPEKGGER